MEKQAFLSSILLAKACVIFYLQCFDHYLSFKKFDFFPWTLCMSVKTKPTLSILLQLYWFPKVCIIIESVSYPLKYSYIVISFVINQIALTLFISLLTIVTQPKVRIKRMYQKKKKKKTHQFHLPKYDEVSIRNCTYNFPFPDILQVQTRRTFASAFLHALHHEHIPLLIRISQNWW